LKYEYLLMLSTLSPERRQHPAPIRCPSIE
jgi:hypothetical protein